MIFLIKLSLISSFILNSGVNFMELSRVSKYLANNPGEYISISDLVSPDELFKSNKTVKEIDTTITLFPEDKFQLINDKSIVLHIGDSHTAGIYGKEMDMLLRKTGAKVTTVGSSGSSPIWWLNETPTKSGFYLKDQDGNLDNPSDWKAPHITPKLINLINKYHPEIIIFSLGANMINTKPERITEEIKEVLEIAKNNNARIIWVGPPNGRSDKKPEELQNFLYEHIKPVVEKYNGYFIDSRPYTHYPETLKGDGVHFWGKEGAKIARDWAKNIFNDIQKSEK